MPCQLGHAGMADRRRVERRCSDLETKPVPDRDPWSLSSESNRLARVRNGGLPRRRREARSGAPDSNRYDEIGNLACCRLNISAAAERTAGVEPAIPEWRSGVSPPTLRPRTLKPHPSESNRDLPSFKRTRRPPTREWGDHRLSENPDGPAAPFALAPSTLGAHASRTPQWRWIRTQGSNLVFAVQSRASFRLDESGMKPR